MKNEVREEKIMKEEKPMGARTTTEVKHEVMVAANTAVARQADERKGFDGITPSELVMPTAKVMQPTSPELMDDNFKDYNLRAGDLVHTMFLEKISTVFTPIVMFDDRILFQPRDEDAVKPLYAKIEEKFAVPKEAYEGEPIICRAKDSRTGSRFGDCLSCPLGEWDGDTPPFCTRNINILAWFDGQSTPVVFRFNGTSYKHGRKFKSLAYFNAGDLFSRKYKLVITKKQEGGKTWFETSVMPAGKTTEEECNRARDLYTTFRGAVITVQEEF